VRQNKSWSNPGITFEGHKVVGAIACRRFSEQGLAGLGSLKNLINRAQLRVAE
jgi:hypothetical protein